MGDSPTRTPTAKIPTSCYGLQYLEDEMLALVGVAAGLKATLVLSTCCASLRDSLACPVLDEELFGRLYASLAGVEEPYDAFLQPPPRHNLSKRHQPSAAPARSSSSTPGYCHHPRHLRPRQCGALASVAPPSPISPSPSPSPLDEAETRSVKRARSLTHGCSPAGAVTAGAAARQDQITNPAHSLLPEGYLPHDLCSAGEGPIPESAEIRQRGRQPETWRMRLKEDVATGRKPLETFVFAGQSKGKQDVLLAVVPSTPPLIAITCTTRMALFSLDGTRLPVIPSGVRSTGDASPRKARDGGAISADAADDTASERGGIGGDGARYFPQRPGGPVSQRASFSAFGASVDGDHGDNGGEGPAQSPDAAAEAHQRDIRCLAASPAGDMIATGSLDCTIRVRSVPGCDWVRRLRGHEAGVRCLAFHQTRKRLVSADSLGMMAVWDVFPVSRRLQVVRGHSDSVQVLTWTGGGERLASGALDGSVVVWLMTPEGNLLPLVTYGGLCHPYRLVAVGRCLAFTSSVAPSILIRHSSLPAGAAGSSTSAERDGDGIGQPVPGSKGAHISVVDVDPTSLTQKDPGCRWVSTGLSRLQHLVAGKCIGAVMLSQTESWAEDSDSSAEGQDDTFLGSGRVTYRPPRICRIVSASRVRSFEESQAARWKPDEPADRHGGEGGGGGDQGPLEAGWMSVSRRLSREEKQPEVPPRHNHMSGKGFASKYEHRHSDDDDDNNDDCEDADGGAFCTCAVFVGRTLFLGYDTGFIYAHRASDGRQLYRLSMFGSVTHLVEAKGSLFAYASSGVVSRWSWDV